MRAAAAATARGHSSGERVELTTGVARYVRQKQHDGTVGHVYVFSVCNSIKLLLNIEGELACACGARQQGRLGLGCKRADGQFEMGASNVASKRL